MRPGKAGQRGLGGVRPARNVVRRPAGAQSVWPRVRLPRRSQAVCRCQHWQQRCDGMRTCGSWDTRPRNLYTSRMPTVLIDLKAATAFAQFIAVCRASNLAEARCISCPLQGSSLAKPQTFSRPSCAHGPHLRPSTHCYKLSEPCNQFNETKRRLAERFGGASQHLQRIRHPREVVITDPIRAAATSTQLLA